MEWMPLMSVMLWLLITGFAGASGVRLSRRFSANWLTDLSAAGYRMRMPVARGKWVDWVFLVWFALAAAYIILVSHAQAVEAAGWLWFVWVMGCLALVDARTALLPNEATLALMLSGLAWQVMWANDIPHERYLWGMMLGYAMPVAMNIVCKPFYRKAVVGLGDAKLLAGMGIWLGIAALPTVWLIASLALLVYTAIWRIKFGRWLTCLPFGPFLVFGASMVLWQCCLE